MDCVIVSVLIVYVWILYFFVRASLRVDLYRIRIRQYWDEFYVSASDCGLSESEEAFELTRRTMAKYCERGEAMSTITAVLWLVASTWYKEKVREEVPIQDVYAERLKKSLLCLDENGRALVEHAHERTYSQFKQLVMQRSFFLLVICTIPGLNTYFERALDSLTHWRYLLVNADVMSGLDLEPFSPFVGQT